MSTRGAIVAAYLQSACAMPLLLFFGCSKPEVIPEAYADISYCQELLALGPRSEIHWALDSSTDVKQKVQDLFGRNDPRTELVLSSWTYTGTNRPCLVIGSTWLYGRYQISLYVPVESAWNDSGQRIRPYTSYAGTVLEIAEMGDKRMDWSKPIFCITPSEWEQVVNAGGDFSVIGRQLITNKPVSYAPMIRYRPH